MHVVVMGPISRGDLLVTSGGATGLARALRSGEARPTGAIVGKALSQLIGPGSGTVSALITLM